MLGDRCVPWSRVVVLCPTNAMAQQYAGLLRSQGIPVSMLTDARTAEAVTVGTWFRSKGLEWPHVFLPQSDRETMLLTGAGEAARAEKAALLRRTLYVAMTERGTPCGSGSCASLERPAAGDPPSPRRARSIQLRRAARTSVMDTPMCGRAA